MTCEVQINMVLEAKEWIAAHAINAERNNGKPPAPESFPFKGQGGVVGGEVIDGRQ